MVWEKQPSDGESTIESHCCDGVTSPEESEVAKNEPQKSSNYLVRKLSSTYKFIPPCAHEQAVSSVICRFLFLVTYLYNNKSASYDYVVGMTVTLAAFPQANAHGAAAGGLLVQGTLYVFLWLHCFYLQFFVFL